MPVEECLAGTSLTPEQLEGSGATVATWQELAVARNLVAAIDDSTGLGVALGRRLHVSGYGPIALASLASPTPRAALALARRFSGLLSVTSRTTVAKVSGGTRLSFDSSRIPAPVRRLLLERDLTAVNTSFHDLTGRKIPLLGLSLPFSRDHTHELLVEEFGVEPVYDANVSTALFPDELLDSPLPQADPDIFREAEADCQALLRRRQSGSSVADQVRVRAWSAELGLLTVDQVAQALLTTPRTLRRRLAEEGTTYRALAEEVRRAAAQDLLGDRTLSVEQVAVRLGYADTAAFSHAFKRWTGSSPAAFRQDRPRP